MERLATRLGEKLIQFDLKIAVAESCTGGWLSKMITDVAGSSQWFDRGFVTYSNNAKMDMLGVNHLTLESYGAVSENTVIEMAHGVLKYSLAEVSVAISGVAGPGGGSDDKPVGLVCFGYARKNMFCESEALRFAGNREQIRYQAACHALSALVSKLGR